MRYAILADIHANLEAFTAILDDISAYGEVEAIWCLGDIVGYGPDPGRCIEILQQCHHVCIAGNHDMAAIGRVDTSYFNPLAVAAIQWRPIALARRAAATRGAPNSTWSLEYDV